MTLREIGLLTIAKLGHDGHQLEPVELRELKRQLAEGTALFRRYREIDDRPCLPMKQTIAAACYVICSSPQQTSPVLVDSALTSSLNSGF